MHANKLMNFALTVGEVMLKNGAETYRVEDTINRILKTSDYQSIESFVTPTGLFATLYDPKFDHMTYIRRVNNRGTHLYRLELANSISRQYCQKQLTLDEAIVAIHEASIEPTYNRYIMIFSTGMVSALFVLVLNGSLSDSFVALICGIVLALFQNLLSKFILTKFFIDIIGGFIVATISLIFYEFIGFGHNLDLIIISAIMPLVPGVAITNAVGDTIRGDLVSGSSRILEAFIIAASIATGVGIALSAYNTILGGILL